MNNIITVTVWSNGPLEDGLIEQAQLTYVYDEDATDDTCTYERSFSQEEYELATQFLPWVHQVKGVSAATLEYAKANASTFLIDLGNAPQEDSDNFIVGLETALANAKSDRITVRANAELEGLEEPVNIIFWRDEEVSDVRGDQS